MQLFVLALTLVVVLFHRLDPAAAASGSSNAEILQQFNVRLGSCYCALRSFSLVGF